MRMDAAALQKMAESYTAAWCSGDPTAVAEFYTESGSLTVNDGPAAVGRAAVAETARAFMTALLDLRLFLDGVVKTGENRADYHWTLTGASAQGHAVRISGSEKWQLNGDGHIAASQGHFDAADYRRQLAEAFAAPRFVSEAEVRAHLPMPELIDAMERALTEFSAGQVEQPVRTVLLFGAIRSYFGVMPSFVPSLPALGAKLVTVCHANAARGLHTHQALIAMLDPTTGRVRALLDGRYITEARTAAVSAVSARRLARTGASVLAILGAGAQARSHWEALRLVRSFREVRVWSPRAASREQFAADTGARPMPSAEAAVRGADVVVTVTASPTPLVQSEWVSEGAHVIAVGACVPSQRELDPALVARSRLIVDSRAAALQEAGDVVIGIAEGHWTAAHIAAELGELPKRLNEREITIFKSLGLAVEDLFAAHLVLQRAGL